MKVPAGLAALFVAAGAAGGTCPSDDQTLCLLDGRFAVRASWSNPYGPGAGDGHAVPLTATTGFFWFFDEQILEVTAKIVDGRDLNDSFWTFFGSLSTVEFLLTYSDRLSGWERSYRNPPFEQTTGAAIDAFEAEPLPGDLLFVGAHPDDESLVAPILSRRCRTDGVRCTFLIMTRGENGPCVLPGGCGPDLGATRSAEMAAVASYYGATLEQRSLPDVGGPTPAAVRSAWAETIGGDAALVERLRRSISESGASTVITLDPRHGSTCHPAHRAIGELVEEANAGLPAAPRLLFVETRFMPLPAFRWEAAAPGDAAALAYDASRPAPPSEGTAWDDLLHGAALHASQVPPALVDALRFLPAGEQRAWVRRADAPPDPRLGTTCGP